MLKYEALEDGLGFIHACQKFKHVPSGRDGGWPGAPVKIVLNEGTDRELVVDKSNAQHVLRKGDTVTHYTPGGGGYGSPTERDRGSVRADLDSGFISAEEARNTYDFEV